MELENQITKCIHQVRTRPGMYIGGKDIALLRNFLDGFHFCLRQNHIPESQYLPPLPFFLFHEYTAKHFGESSVCKGYAMILQEHCNGDGELALEQFFLLYDSFCEIAIQSITYAVSPDKKTCFYKIKLNGTFGYLLVIKNQEKCIVKPDVVPFCRYFISNEIAVDRFTATVCSTWFEGWTDSKEHYIFSEKGFFSF